MKQRYSAWFVPAFFTTVVFALFFAVPQVDASVTAYWISSPSDLLTGTQADGQVSDMMIENDEIAIVISRMGHTVGYGSTGGNIIDAGSSIDRIDGLEELYGYLNDDWPRQPEYSSLSIIDDGSGGGPAIVRAVGVDSDNSNIAVVTDYILEDDDEYLTITSSFTNNGGSKVNNYEMGDAFAWGSCQMFAPGYGFNVSGNTTEEWMAGTADEVTYGYVSPSYTLWGPHGGGWSDLNVRTVSISSGDTAVCNRMFVVGGIDIASVSTLIHEITAVAVGSLYCSVSDISGPSPIAGAAINVYDDTEAIYTQMETDSTGNAFATLPPGSWHIEATDPEYSPSDTWVSISTGSAVSHDFYLEYDDSIPPIGDTLTVIQRPILNVPTIVTPGDTFDINCEADPATTGWTASLVYGSITVPLQIVSSSYSASTTWWTIEAAVPSPITLYELYDLAVAANGGIMDTTENAVHVIPAFKDDYYFIQFTDTHLPTHLYVYETGADTDTSEINDYRAVNDDIALINPEFVLHTGDLVNEGELEDYLHRRYFTRTQRLIAECTVPFYLVAGNHDIGGWDSTPPSDGTARRDWWRFFGWKRCDDPPAGAPEYTQNYSFDYGPVHYVGLEAYDNYDSWRYEIYGAESFTSGQMSWLTSDLAAASGSASQVLFYHYDFDNEINLNSLGVEMALWGHIHSNSGSISSPPYDLATDNVCDGARSYRLVRVSSGTLQPTNSISAGSSGGNLSVQYTPSNDGSSPEVTAQITNNLNESFEHGMIRFVMPPGGGSADVTGGTLFQIDNSDSLPVYYVSVNIQSSSSQNVTISLTQTNVAGGETEIPRVLKLGQNHPNPFNPSTSIRFDLPKPGHVKLVLYDIRGREIAKLVDNNYPVGTHTAKWDGRDTRGNDAPSGAYLARLTIGGEARTRKIILAR